MQDRKTKASRRAQQAHEVEENQSALRKNIAEAAASLMKQTRCCVVTTRSVKTMKPTDSSRTGE